MSSNDEATVMWRRLRAAQERKLEASATNLQSQAVHRRLAEMHEQALSEGSYRLQIVGER